MTNAMTQRLLRVAGMGVVAVGGISLREDVSLVSAHSETGYAVHGSAASRPSHYGTHDDMEAIVPALEQLRGLAQLGDNWDSYGADSISPVAIATASLLISSVDEDRVRHGGRHAAPWMVAPLPDGGVQVEWKIASRKIQIQIDPEGAMSYLTVDRSHLVPSYTEEHEVSLGRIRSLVELVYAA
jgi:hypothetical protein